MKLAVVLTLATVIAAMLPSESLAQRLQRSGGSISPLVSTTQLQGYAADTSVSGGAFASPPASLGAVNSNAFAGSPRSAYAAVPLKNRSLAGNASSLAPGSFSAPPHLPGAGYRPSFSASLSQQDLSILGAREVIVLIDKSGSMSEEDCPIPRGAGAGMATGMFNMFATAAGVRRQQRPGVVSRWDWTGSQLMSLSGATSSVLPRGITTVFFDGDATVYSNVRVQQIPALFSRERPNGTTDVTGALREQLNAYFRRKQVDPVNTRPLAVAVITDGLPNNISSLKSVLVDASKRVSHPSEIAVTFLQVGRERKGFELLAELDDGLYMRGAQHDIVDSKVFPEVARFGLARALVLAITERAGY